MDQNRLPTVLAIARQSQRITQALVPLFPAVVLIGVSLVLGDDSAVRLACHVVLGIFLVVAGIYQAWVYRRTDHFIEAVTPQ